MATIPLTISGIDKAKQQLQDLNAEFEKVKNDPIESKKVAKQFNDLSKSIDGTTEALNELNSSGEHLTATFEDIYGEGAKPLSNQISELEDRLYSMAIAGEQGSDEFKKMSVQVGKLKGTIISVDKSIDLLAENRGLTIFSTGISQVGERLLRLDFEGASKDAKALNDNIGNLGKLGKNALTGLAKTVGQLSKAFIRMGVALLANPIFLITTAIVALIAIIGVVLNKLGFLQPVLEAFGYVFGIIKDAINQTIQALKDFTDWLGITNFAGEEFANKQIEVFTKVADKAKEMGDAKTKAIDQEIRLAKIAGEDVEDAEIRKQNVIIATQKILAETARLSIEANKVSNKLTAEELTKLEDQLKSAETLIKDSEFEIKAIKAQSDAEEDTRRETQLAKDRENYKKRLEEQKKFEKDRLNTARQIEDLRLQVVEEGIQRDLALNDVKYQRLIEDTKSNETLLAEEKAEIIELLRLQADQKAEQIALADAEKDVAKREKQAEEDRARAEQIQADALEWQQLSLDAKNAKDEQDKADQLARDEAYAQAKVGLEASLMGSLTTLASELEKQGVRTAGLQKTLAVVQIAMDTAKAIGAVISGATAAAAAGGPLAPFLIAGYVASGIATVASGIAQAKSALESAPSIGGGGGTVASVGAVTASQPAQPNFELFGQNNDANNLSAPQENDQTIVVEAVVSETEVTSTQNKVKKMQDSASL